jgi:hypothetical protein
MGSFDAKKPPSKISCLGTFKGSPVEDSVRSSYYLFPLVYWVNRLRHVTKVHPWFVSRGIGTGLLC